MKCKDRHQHLISLLYGEANPEEAKETKKHLKSCHDCRKIFEELQKTTSILESWKDEKPEMNFIFVRESASRWNEWKQWIGRLGWKKRLAWGLPLATTAILILFAIVNFRVQYENGNWNFSFGRQQTDNRTISKQELVTLIAEKQKETLLLVSEILEQSETRNKTEMALTLNRLTESIENQRQRDLELVGQGLEGLHRNTEGRFNQTNRALNNLIQLTGYNIQKK